MQVVITGVAGFIGSNLADRLIADGARVRGIDDLSAGVVEQVSAEVDFVEDDITTADLIKVFKGADIIYHLAAFSSVVGCQRDLSTATIVNAGGTARVLDAMALAKVPKIVAAETSAVYEGTSVYPTPETEDAPRTIYAITKRCAGRLIHAAAKDMGIAATTLRYFNVYGPRQDYRREIAPVMIAFARALLAGQAPVIFGDGSKRRDFIHVDDINAFHLLAATDERVNGQAFNLGTGSSYSVLEILRRIEAATGVTIEPRHLPGLESEAPLTTADITKAKSIGWSPEVDIDAGIRSCVDYMQSVLRVRGAGSGPS